MKNIRGGMDSKGAHEFGPKNEFYLIFYPQNSNENEVRLKGTINQNLKFGGPNHPLIVEGFPLQNFLPFESTSLLRPCHPSLPPHRSSMVWFTVVVHIARSQCIACARLSLLESPSSSSMYWPLPCTCKLPLSGIHLSMTPLAQTLGPKPCGTLCAMWATRYALVLRYPKC